MRRTLVHFGAVVADAPSPLSTPRSATGQAPLRLGKPARMKCRASHPQLALTLVSDGACGFAGAGMLSVSAARQFVKLPEQAAAALLTVDARRSRPARSSTSLFDQLGDTSSTGTLQASSAQRALRRAAALLEKMGCCSRGPWSAFPWSWRPPRSSTGKTKVVGLVELSMPAPLHYAHYDGISMH